VGANILNRAMNPRSVALIALILLATVALLAMGTAADREFHDWKVNQPIQMVDEDINVSGTLQIYDIGSLHLTRCTLWFNSGEADDLRLHIIGGSLVLEDSRIVSENGGLISVGGHLEIKGSAQILFMNIWVDTMGTIAAREASVTLIGNSTSTYDVTPVELKVGGSAVFVNSDVSLRRAFISSTGSFSFIKSTIESTFDFNWPYADGVEHLRFNGGTASLVDSTFYDLDGGVRSMADITVRDCEFRTAGLKLYAPIWLTELDAWVDGCTFTDSDLMVSLDNSLHVTKAVDILISDLEMDNGNMELDLQEAYSGSIVIQDVKIKRFSGYGVVIKASGIDGTLLLDNLDVDGPRGIQALHDYSGMRIVNSTITAETTALEMIGSYASIPAYLEGVTLTGDPGLRARTTVVMVMASDLSASRVPVSGEDGSAVMLTDCLLDEGALRLNVQPGERSASIKVDRHMEIDGTRWSIGDPIEEGTVLFYVYSGDTLFPTVKQWKVGSGVPVLVRLLEWTKNAQGFEERLVFNDVVPYLVIEGTTFETIETFTMDPWQDDTFELVFKDDVKPWLAVSGDVPFVINDPYWLLHGTCGDVGTGIDGVQWFLYTSVGELVSSGDVDFLSDGRWQTTIYITGNMQRVQMLPRDRSGNDDFVPLQPVGVMVPTPLLTVVRPEARTLTNVEFITVTGTADFYASEVQIQVLGHSDVITVPVVMGHFSKIFQIPQEGLNDLIISSHDPYGGFDEKRVAVTLDTIAPAIMLDGLAVTETNYLNNPSLVISGSIDDPKATIVVLGQVVGLVGSDFATTVTIVEGAQTIKVLARDVVGNENRINLEIVLDTSKPMLTLVNPKVSPFWSTEYEVQVVLEVDEALSQAIVNGETVQVVDGRITHEARLGHGPYEVSVHVFDLAGNEAEKQLVLRLDMEPPTLNFINPRQGQVVNTTAVPIVVVTSEPRCSLFIDDGTSLVQIATTEQDAGRLVGIMYLTPGEGERTVTIVIKDRAGNSVTKNLDLDIDTVIPYISVPGFYDGKKVTTEPIKIKGFTEPDAKVVWVNGQMASLNADGEFSTTIELAEGWQDVRIVVLDRAGNSFDVTYRVKALGEPSFDPPIEALAAATILVTMGALAVTTEIGRWSLLSILVPMYTKLQKDKILDQRTRGLIEGYITANPGANYTIIRDNLSLADGTLTYHLQVLEREGFVYSIREGLFRCFYPQGVPPPRRGKLHLSDVQSDVVRIVKRIPGITVGEIATAMNRRPNVISYHLKLLREGGLIRMEEDGRHVRIYPIDTAVAMI